MEAAAASGFRHVPTHVRQRCLNDIAVTGLRYVHQQAGALINAYRHQWGWSDVDVARAMRHVLEPKAPAARKPEAEADVYGETLRDDTWTSSMLRVL